MNHKNYIEEFESRFEELRELYFKTEGELESINKETDEKNYELKLKFLDVLDEALTMAVKVEALYKGAPEIFLEKEDFIEAVVNLTQQITYMLVTNGVQMKLKSNQRIEEKLEYDKQTIEIENENI